MAFSLKLEGLEVHPLVPVSRPVTPVAAVQSMAVEKVDKQVNNLHPLDSVFCGSCVASVVAMCVVLVVTI